MSDSDLQSKSPGYGVTPLRRPVHGRCNAGSLPVVTLLSPSFTCSNDSNLACRLYSLFPLWRATRSSPTFACLLYARLAQNPWPSPFPQTRLFRSQYATGEYSAERKGRAHSVLPPKKVRKTLLLVKAIRHARSEITTGSPAGLRPHAGSSLDEQSK